MRHTALAGALALATAGIPAGTRGQEAAPAQVPAAPAADPGVPVEATATMPAGDPATPAEPGGVTVIDAGPADGDGAPVFTVGRDDLARWPSIDDDVHRAMHVLPSATGDDFSARFALRGGESDEIEVRLDGLELYDGFHLQDYGGAVSVLDAAWIERADLHAGAFPARYGDRMGGVLDVTTRWRDDGAFHGHAGLDLLAAGAWLEAPFPDGAAFVAGRRGYIDLFLDAWGGDIDFRPRYWDVYGKARVRATATDEVSVHALYSGDRNTMSIAEGPVRSRYDSGSGWLRWRRWLGGGASSEIVVFGTGGTRDRDLGLEGRDDRVIGSAGLRWEGTFPAGTHEVRTGLRFRYLHGDYDYFDPAAVDLDTGVAREVAVDTRSQDWDVAAWVQDDWRPVRSLTVGFGARGTLHGGAGTGWVDPRVQAAWDPHPAVRLRAALGLHHQAVTALDLPVEEGIGTPRSPERNVHVTGGIEWRPPGLPFTVRTDAWWKEGWDLAGHVPNLGREERAFTSARESRAWGLEVFGRGTVGPYLGWHAGYALSWARERADAGWYPRASDRRHSVVIGASVRLWKEIRLSGSWRYRTGAPYTEVTAIDADGTRTYGRPNARRLPDYHSLDLRLSGAFRFTSWTLEAYLQVVNAYARSNLEEVRFTRAPDGTVAAAGESFLPVLPTLGIGGEF